MGSNYNFYSTTYLILREATAFCQMNYVADAYISLSWTEMDSSRPPLNISEDGAQKIR